MKYAFTTIPGILWIVTAVVLFFYRLNKKRYNEIVEDLKNQKIRAIIHLAELVNLGKNETIQQLAEGMHMTTEEAEKWYKEYRKHS